MPFTDQRLFRARGLEPVLGINEIALVLDQNGPIRKYQSPFMQVLGVEPVTGLGPHGVMLIYNQSTSAPAGYAQPAGVPTGTLAAGASAQFVNPTILQNGPRQLTQLRWLVRPLALTGPAVGDIDIQFFLPGAVGRFGLLNQSPGYINMIDQVPEPADAALEPAQGANMTQQTSPPAISARDNANLTEFFIFEINGPTFKIINNGSASLSAGAIGLRVSGFRFDLAPVSDDGSWSMQLVMGQRMKAPARFVPIPTGPFVATGSYGS